MQTTMGQNHDKKDWNSPLWKMVYFWFKPNLYVHCKHKSLGWCSREHGYGDSLVNHTLNALIYYMTKTIVTHTYAELKYCQYHNDKYINDIKIREIYVLCTDLETLYSFVY